MTQRWTDSCNFLPLHLTRVDLGTDVQRHRAIGQRWVRLFHGAKRINVIDDGLDGRNPGIAPMRQQALCAADFNRLAIRQS